MAAFLTSFILSDDLLLLLDGEPCVSNVEKGGWSILGSFRLLKTTVQLNAVVLFVQFF